MTKTIVILHGWRLSGTKYHEIQTIFEGKGFCVFAPDLPGSGEEKLTKPVMTIDDYVAFVMQFLKKNKLKKVILIGHSFGGRIAVKFAVQHPEAVEALILTGAPLIKKDLPIQKKMIVYTAKGIKKLLNNNFLRKMAYVLLGEWDYYKTTPEIRETFKAIIAEDSKPLLSHIAVSTCIIWGGNDTFVGKTLGKDIADCIPGAAYREIAGASHKLPYEYPKDFAENVLQWIGQL